MKVGYSTIGVALRDARLSKDMSQSELASFLGMTQGIVSRAELGGDLRIATLTELARALDLAIVLVPRRIVAPIRVILGSTEVSTRRHPLDVHGGDGPYDEGDFEPIASAERATRVRRCARTKKL